MRRVPLHLLLAALAPLAAATAAAEPARFDVLWVEPVRGADGARDPACLTAAVLNLPPAWQAGDAAAAVLAPHAAVAEAAPVVAALVGEGTAVLELASDLGCEEGPGPTRPDPPAPRDWLLGGLDALRRDLGAGLLVALGLGPEAGGAALAAARAARAARGGGGAPPPPAAARLAAAGAVGAAAAAFEPGAAPPPEEAWPVRAPLLCAALEGALAPGAGGACRAALGPAVARGDGPRVRQAAR